MWLTDALCHTAISALYAWLSVPDCFLWDKLQTVAKGLFKQTRLRRWPL